MSTTNDGDAAFPRPSDAHYNCPQKGMSLRDWFAGMALQGLLANNETSYTPKANAEESYKNADEMLAARERKEDT